MIRIVYFIALFLPGIVTAQKLPFHHLGTDKGLIQSDINHITQDKKGNIWIATNAGISVYDGKKFTNYDELKKISSLRINNILCDHNGIIWIATDNGLLKFDKEFIQVFKPDPQANRRMFQLALDRENNKYFIYNREIFRVANGSDSVVKWNLNIPSRSPIIVISIDERNNFWVGTANAEAYKISGDKVTRLKVPTFPTPFHGTSPLAFFYIRHSADLTAFTSSKGIFIVDNDSLVHVGDKYYGIPERSRTNAVLRTGLSSTWVGSDSGVFKINPQGGLKQITKANGFTNNSVTAIFEDAEKNLWFGTYGNGVFQLSTEALSLYDQVDKIDLSNIESITKTEAGEVILASYSQGMVKMKEQTFIKNPFTSRPPFFRYVTGLAAMGTVTIIGTFGQGILEYDNKTSALYRSRLNVHEEFINAILPYKRGFLVYAAGRVLYSFDNNFRLIARKEIPVSSLFALTDSTIILIQNGVVDIYDAHINLLQKNLFTEIHSRISCLHFFNGYFLVGTIGEGLFLYDSSFRYLRKLPSRSNIIYSLKVSGDHLFVGSNVGLSKFPINGFPDISIANEKLMFTGECKEEGILEYSPDTIMVTTSRGLFVINTREEDFNFTKPVLTVEGIQFKNNENRQATDITEAFRTLSRNNSFNIPYSKNEFQVSLKGISQSSPDFLQYKFILENYESKWNTTDNGDLIRYTNLKPGKYVFKARLYAKGSASPLISIPFTIDKPLQAKWWFQALVFVLFIAFAILLLKIFNNLNQRYVQTKWINRSTSELQNKKTLIGQLVKSTKTDLQLFKEYLNPQSKQNRTETDKYLEFYFKTTMNRLDILWEKDFMNLAQLNEALKNFTQSSFDTVVDISHTSSNESVLIPSDKAEKIIRLFSLFIFYSMETNHARQFAVTSKVRLGNQLFLKIYSTEALRNSSKNKIHRHLQNCVRDLNRHDFAIEFIESQNLGNMIILSMNLESAHAIKADRINQPIDEQNI